MGLDPYGIQLVIFSTASAFAFQPKSACILDPQRDYSFQAEANWGQAKAQANGDLGRRLGKATSELAQSDLTANQPKQFVPVPVFSFYSHTLLFMSYKPEALGFFLPIVCVLRSELPRNHA